ncbi:hypothetical protein [Variovorax sp. YR216]|uniref:hypothetical protein n=1 Tax=Variovorax sp. YR216 TaxID=1882828 RepID=UPI00089A0748|nr:hypothetical protein [Variovorax sp. YR216]SEB10018.1 hypothetical protein SAMN05444680_107237 [Variovorax sp. YR216]
MTFKELRISGPDFAPYVLGEPMYVHDRSVQLGTLDPIHVTRAGTNVHIGRFIATRFLKAGKRNIDPLVLLEVISFISERFLAVQTVSFSLRSEVASYEDGLKIASARAALLQRIGTHRVTISPQPDSTTPGNFVVHGVWAYNELNLAALGQCLKLEREIYRDCEVLAPEARRSLRSRLRRLLSRDENF